MKFFSIYEPVALKQIMCFLFCATSFILKWLFNVATSCFLAIYRKCRSWESIEGHGYLKGANYLACNYTRKVLIGGVAWQSTELYSSS